MDGEGRPKIGRNGSVSSGNQGLQQVITPRIMTIKIIIVIIIIIIIIIIVIIIIIKNRLNISEEKLIGRIFEP